MRRRNLEKLMAWICIADITAGMILASGVTEGSFHLDPFKMFTMLNAMWALVYFVLELRYLKIGGKGVISSAMHFTILVNSTGMAVIGFLYLQPMHESLVGPDYLSMVLIQYLLPILLIIDYLVGLKDTFRKKQIPYVMGFPIVYDLFALAMGAAGHGFGMNNATYPYPLLNVDQLGWGIVITNLCMVIVVLYLYCRLWIALDRMGKHHG